MTTSLEPIQTEYNLTDQQEHAAFCIASGMTRRDTATECGCGEATIYRWLRDEQFAAEVDRLTFLTGVAVKAERVRAMKKLIRSRMDEDGIFDSKRDVFDWIKLLREELGDLEFVASLVLMGAIDE